MNNLEIGKTIRITQWALLFVLLSIGTGCHSGKHGHKEEKFKVTSPARRDQSITREYVAQLKAIQHIELRAFERGYLQNIFVDEGQLVKKDEKMFEIMPTLNRAEYNKSKAEVDLAKIEYENTKKLKKQNVVSANELALAKAKYEKALADLDLAKIHLDLTEIKAPFDGLMDRFQVRLGSLVEEGELLTTLSDNSKIWAYFNVSEADYLDYKSHESEVKALPVRLKMANSKMFNQEGVIDTIEADFNNETGNIAFRASFPNPNGLLRHGETGNIQISFPLKDALVIPQKATFEILDKKFVYVVDEQNIVHSREVKIEEELPNIFIISSGLKETDKILLDGLGKVEIGKKIAIDFQSPDEALANLDLPTE
ncbi:MAG: efflux RND transporter periplasmic adaptor subunit [Bdellovibrionales bacterium]|nr:efflux RND transporter periplasmic adaptor subunit [Bdellovibrionales bacterium]